MQRSGQRWWLDDAEALNRRYPDSFFIPSRERRAALVPGDSVKLVFRFEPPAEHANAERMWVDVARVARDGYVGTLVNQPRHIETIGPGTTIRFRPEHVASLAVSQQEIGYDVEALAAVSRRIRDEGAWPHFVYRNATDLRDDDARDSGWQLWARQDDDEYAADPENVISWELGWITDKFPAVEELFRAQPERGEWWWDDVQERYRRRA